MRPALLLPNTRVACAAFTMVEVLITSSLVAIMGGLVFLSLHAGVHLFGKNVAINLPYQSSRAAFDLLQRDLHGSAAAPRLIDANLADVTGAGPAAGVALRGYASGPCVVAADAASTATVLEIRQTAGFAPHVGDLISLPAFRVERAVTAVSTVGSTWVVTLDAALGATLSGTATSNFVAFFTRRIGYVVVNGQLRRYPELSMPSTFAVVARGVTNPTPFSHPVTAGVPDQRYLAVTLTAHDPGHSSRQWAAVDSNLKFTLSYRATTPLTTQ